MAIKRVLGLSALNPAGNTYTVEAYVQLDSGREEVRVCDPFEARSFSDAIDARAHHDFESWALLSVVKN